MIENLKVVCFDLWNTLIETSFYTEERVQYFHNILKNNGFTITYDVLEDIYMKVNKFDSNYSKKYNHKHVYNRTRMNSMLDLLDISLSEEIIEDLNKYFETILLKRPPKLKPNVKKILAKLSEKYPLALISDTGLTPGNILSDMLKFHDIHKYFTYFTYSDETGFFKPDHHNFNITLEKLGIRPHEAVHIGDMLDTDILGANIIGMKSIWIKTDEFYRPGSEKEIIPDFIIEDFEELHNILLA